MQIWINAFILYSHRVEVTRIFHDAIRFCFNLAKAILVLFIIVDPLGSIPIFIGLTGEMTENQKRKVFKTAFIVGFVLLLVFAFTGLEIFNIFGISIYSFEVAGGILLLIICNKSFDFRNKSLKTSNRQKA